MYYLTLFFSFSLSLFLPLSVCLSLSVSLSLTFVTLHINPHSNPLFAFLSLLSLEKESGSPPAPGRRLFFLLFDPAARGELFFFQHGH